MRIPARDRVFRPANEKEFEKQGLCCDSCPGMARAPFPGQTPGS